MKPRIDPSTRTVLEPAPSRPDPNRVARERFDPVSGQSGARPTFVELCTRSTFSGISVDGPAEGFARGPSAWPGSGTPDEIADRHAIVHADAFALTDLDTLAGVVRAHRRARELEMRLIVGCELRLPAGSLVLHAESKEGWTNLCALLTRSRAGREKGDIAYRFDDVVDHAAGLWALALPPFDTARLGDLKDAYGERLSIGIWRHHTPEDAPRLRWTKAQSQRLQVPLLATSRAFLVERCDKRLHDVLTCIRQGLRLQDAGQRLLPNGEAHLRSAPEMLELFRDVPEAVRRSRDVADACTFQLSDLHYTYPTEGKDEPAPQRLRRLTAEGAVHRYGASLSEKHQKQIEHELAIIEDLDVSAYFLTVKSIVDVANDKGILCQGRGSAANSVVCYCLGITSVDPVAMEMLFERFLSRERGEPPDIDVDFEHERREEVIQEIYRRWGRDHAAMVSEVISFRGKSAVREVGKVFGLTEAITGRIAGLMHHSVLGELPRELTESGVDVDSITQTLFYASRLQGHPRHLGIHVGGFVLTRDPINTVAPIEPARMADRTVLPWDKDDVDTLGFFKMDVLGLGMLTCIRKSFEMIEAHGLDGQPGEHLELHTIPIEDDAVFDALCKADTVGVFQVESRAQMSMLPRLKPRCFYDLVVQVAIVRPGPIQGGMIHPYLKAREALARGVPPTMPHESLRGVLGRTLGVPLFQEQVMRIAIEGAGYTAGEADQLRRDMAAWKKTGRLARHRQRLVEGFKSKGISDEMAERMFLQVQGFGEYGFPESHAASFARLAWVSAWLKVHHPAVFCAALINSHPMGFYAPSQLVSDVKAHGVVVLPITLHDSGWDCSLELVDQKLAIRLGLRLVKGLSEQTGRRIEDERKAHGAYVDVGDLARRCRLNKKERQALARSGALDVVSAHRRAAVWNAILDRPPLFEGLRDDDVGDLLAKASQPELLLMDYAHTGLSLDDHPMNHLRARLVKLLGKEKLLTAKEVNNVPRTTRGTTAGLVIGRQRPGTADGTCFVTLEDETGTVNVVVWGRDFDRWHATVVSSSFLLFRGKIERQDGVVHLIAQDVAAVAADLANTSEGGDDAQLAFPFQARSFH